MTTEDKLEEMENSIEKMDGKLDEVLHCLKGNDMGQVGLVSKVGLLEDRFKQLEDKILIEKTESKIYKDIAKYLLGIIVVLVIGYLFNQALN